MSASNRGRSVEVEIDLRTIAKAYAAAISWLRIIDEDARYFEACKTAAKKGLAEIEEILEHRESW